MSPSPWLLAARPKTLPAAIVPVWVGSMPVLVDGDPATGSWGLFVCALAGCIFIQIATNLFNDAIDHEKGADTEKRLGPRRVTASGLLPRRAVFAGAIAFCLLAAFFALPMIAARGWAIVGIGLVSLFFAHGYTGGPFPLAYRGMGELFVILFFGFVAVLGSWFVQTGELGGASMWILGAQCGLYSSVLIAINNFRDVEEDAETGKRTLAVRFGPGFARAEIAAFCLLPPCLWVAWWVLSGEAKAGGGLRVAFAIAVTLPLGLMIVRGILAHEPSGIYNRFLALGGVQLLLFGASATVVFWKG